MNKTLLAVLAFAPALLAAQQAPRAIFTDPPHLAKHAATMEVLHIPSGGVQVNGVAYLAAGASAESRKPTFVFFHGFPGNEKNLDLAQAVRRAGWNAVTINYRGTWGSPGTFSFAGNIDDAAATLAFLRAPTNAAKYGIDTTRLVIAGHSMGGWVVSLLAARDHNLRGVIMISAADMGGRVATMTRAQLIPFMADNLETLAGVTAESLSDQILADGPSRTMAIAARTFGSVPLLALTSDDGLAGHTDAFVKDVRAAGNTHVILTHVATDHSWSDRRIALESAVIVWLQKVGK
ncbi:MAG: alpha/beta hydrolase [Gemmatimonadetes bacterium]|nr:alpha/beta hydrolase [Gemmatimonadota bacterium]